MEWDVLVEQEKQGLDENVVETDEKSVEKPKNKRSQSDKFGINRWNQELLKQALAGIEDLKMELRWFRNKIDRIGEADYSRLDVEHFALVDEVDREIVQRVREAGVPGVLPKVVAVDVNQRGSFNLKYYDVSRRILRMNKRLHKETGKCLFEKRGHHWALTRFAFDSYDEPIEQKSEVSTAGSEEGLGLEKEDF
jgi:hypothetical protein